MSTGSIHDTLRQRFEASLPEFYERRIIFWCDEEREFEDLFDQMEFSGIKKAKLTGANSFAVKKLLLHVDLNHNYLIYDPLTYERPQDDWLRDIRLFSEEYRADYLSMLMEELHVENTPLMRKTVRLYKKFFENKERKIKFQKLNHEYCTPASFQNDVMAVLAGVPGGSDQDNMIAVLSADLCAEKNGVLNQIKKFGNADQFWEMVQRLTGYENSDSNGEKPLGFFAAHVLLTALAHTMQDRAFRNLEQYISSANTAYCYSLVHLWQREKDMGALLEVCRSVEEELNLSQRFSLLDTDVLLSGDVFPAIQENILLRFLDEISGQIIRTEAIFKTVENRRTSCWYERFAEYYQCLFYLAELQNLLEKNPDGFHIALPEEVWTYYIKEGYQADSAYRHLHFHFGRALEDPNPMIEDKLKAAMEYADVLYQQNFLKPLTDCWLNTAGEELTSEGYVRSISKQKDFYKKYVRTVTEKHSRAFVIISDGLRYETAVQLREELSRTTRGTAKIEAMQSIFPSITSFGMAALLPGAQLSVNENHDVLVDGMNAVTTEDRRKILCRANPNSVAARYSDILSMTRGQRRELVSGKKVVYIYHNTIDAMGDEPKTERKVFEACDDTIREITALVRVIINDMQGTDIMITADHGFLYTYSPLAESDKISRAIFDGVIYDLGRRYALTAPETKADFLLPVNLCRQIGGIQVKGYAPRDMIRIKTAGAGQNYVHGGVSLQEMVVPVILFKNQKAGGRQSIEATKAELILVNENRRISNSIFSLDFLQKQPVGDKVLPCEYTVYMADRDGNPISDRKKVIADKTAAGESDRVTRVTFSMRPGVRQNDSTCKLIIANDTDVPQEIGFNVSIAFSDEFDF